MHHFKPILRENYENFLERKSKFNNTAPGEQMWQSQLADYRATRTLTTRQQNKPPSKVLTMKPAKTFTIFGQIMPTD